VKIVIGTPFLNKDRFLREAFDSGRPQHAPSLERLILDDGSTDETLPLLQSLQGQHARSARVASLELVPHLFVAVMRSTENMLRGHYLAQYLAAPDED